jgi:hypothetical protein
MLSELHSLNLKLCNKQYNKFVLLHLTFDNKQLDIWKKLNTKNSNKKFEQNSRTFFFVPQWPIPPSVFYECGPANIINFLTAVITPLAAYFSMILTELRR